MKVTRDEAQNALDNLETQHPFMNEYAYNTIHELIESVLKDLTKEEVKPTMPEPTTKKGRRRL